MPCYQSTSLPSGVTTAGRTGYATEADCLQACREGACCEGTTCTVKPQCQCQGTGQTFKGVGTTCSPNPCGCCDSPKVWQLVFYVNCTSSPFLGTCWPAEDADCGCNKIPAPTVNGSSVINKMATYSTWTVDGNKGIACVSQPGACGAYESEELCKQAGSNRVGRSSSYDVTCKGISGGMLWGNAYGYDPGNDPNWYGYKTMYDCVRCDNPLP